MPSRADAIRRVAETVLHAVAIVALAVLLWRALHPAATSGADAASGNLASTLDRWTRRPPASMHVRFDAAPDPVTRDWLRALSRAGGTVQWATARPIRPAAVAAEPLPEPRGGTRVRLAVAAGEAVTVGDGAGVIDTLSRGGTAEFDLASLVGSVHAAGPTFDAATTERDSVVLRPVLVVGAAGWESKFTIASLEERGWRVASRVRVAPGVEITGGPLGAVDTSRYAAVILLDSTAVGMSSAVARYARAGGGVILAGNAARLTAFAGLTPGATGRRVAGVAGGISTASPRTGLGAFPVVSLKTDAVPLETRDGATLVAARRVDAGRVLQLGYDETWRWRMGGSDDAVAAHREWWSRLVAAVAYAPIVAKPRDATSTIDETPLATLIDVLGQPTAMQIGPATRPDDAWVTRVLFAIVIASLMVEWASRRLRGAR